MPRSKAGAQHGSTPATAALVAANVDFVTHPYTHHGDATHFGAEAAAALDVDPRRIFKTLVAQVDDHLVVAVLPVAGQVDFKALARAAGGKKAQLADARVASRTSGYVIGGISPIGQRRSLPTVVDASAETFATIFVSGGKRGLQIELAPQRLFAVTAATVAGIVAAPT